MLPFAVISHSRLRHRAARGGPCDNSTFAPAAWPGQVHARAEHDDQAWYPSPSYPFPAEMTSPAVNMPPTEATLTSLAGYPSMHHVGKHVSAVPDGACHEAPASYAYLHGCSKLSHAMPLTSMQHIPTGSSPEVPVSTHSNAQAAAAAHLHTMHNQPSQDLPAPGLQPPGKEPGTLGFSQLSPELQAQLRRLLQLNKSAPSLRMPPLTGAAASDPGPRPFPGQPTSAAFPCVNSSASMAKEQAPLHLPQRLSAAILPTVLDLPIAGLGGAQHAHAASQSSLSVPLDARHAINTRPDHPEYREELESSMTNPRYALTNLCKAMDCQIPLQSAGHLQGPCCVRNDLARALSTAAQGKHGFQSILSRLL